ncbi:TolC family protein [Aquabacterium sp. J223]|uniref:TolC family protein n=1 Tax=Aquabacterium sp. J223 TaxID=2898431 RepID=UPI0021AD8AC1|nr:TolC family protein [Aquabacterium sp. J223]UUX94962.1 TolC family protein [Aquabacterium sp. J223]
MRSCRSSRFPWSACALVAALLLPVGALAQPADPVPPLPAMPAPAPLGPVPELVVPQLNLPSGQAYRLDDLLALAREANPALAAARARITAAQAGLITAGAYPNPDIEVMTGRQRARLPAAAGGNGQSLSITQPIERPALREARRNVAESSLEGSRAAAGSFSLDLLTDLQLRYYALLRAAADARNAREDLALAEQIRNRVAVRVDTGEAPRFELIRADTERLNAQRAVQAAVLRVQQARNELRRLVGPTLPTDFRLVGSIEDPPGAPPASLEALRVSVLQRHPELRLARAELQTAEARLALERQRRLPAFALRGTSEQEPDVRINRVGVVVNVPLFDRRVGPIAEAEAELMRLRSSLADRELQIGQQLEIAWQQYELAAGQVAALEGGVLRQAADAMRVAEAAYRAGERGILEWLDTQRAFRLARNDLNTARYDLRAALVELGRLGAELP